jgi:hypothetical protein
MVVHGDTVVVHGSGTLVVRPGPGEGPLLGRGRSQSLDQGRPGSVRGDLGTGEDQEGGEAGREGKGMGQVHVVTWWRPCTFNDETFAANGMICLLMMGNGTGACRPLPSPRWAEAQDL